MFSCEFYEIFKNTFFKKYLWATASDEYQNFNNWVRFKVKFSSDL